MPPTTPTRLLALLSALSLVPILALFALAEIPSAPPASDRPMSLIIPEARFHGVSALTVARELARRAGVDLQTQPNIPDRTIDLELNNISVHDAFTQVLGQAGLFGETNGKALFVLSPPVDTSTPEQTATDMPHDPNKTVAPDLQPTLQKSQEAYLAKDYDQSLALLKTALAGCYRVSGQEGTTYDIIRRFQQIYQLKEMSPAEALRDFNQDAYLSQYLLRFYKRAELEAGNFPDFLRCVDLLNKHTDTFATTTTSGNPPSLPDQITWLESTVLGQTFETEPLDDRLSRLEHEVFGKPKTNHPMPDRVNALMKVMQPGSRTATAPGASKSNWFLNPPPVPWLNSIGKGMNTAGKALVGAPAAAINGGHTVLKSPLFWDTVLLAGAATGAYFLLRNNHGGLGWGSAPNYAYSEHACIGSGNCPYCTNCNYCHHCNSFLANKCNIFYLARGFAWH